MKYVVYGGRPGESKPAQTEKCATLREARSAAFKMAKSLGNASRPVWCGPNAWHANDESEYDVAVGGYDTSTPDFDGVSAVIYTKSGK